MNGVGTYPWYSDQVDTLRDLRAEGLSASKIAAELQALYRIPITRNAVIGKCARLGIPSPRSKRDHSLQVKPYKRRAARKIVHRPANRPSLQDRQRAIEAIQLAGAEACELPPDKSDCAVTFFQLEEHHCRWPIGSGRPQLFCGAAKYEGFSYCGRHCRVAYQYYRPSSVERQRGGREASATVGLDIAQSRSERREG